VVPIIHYTKKHLGLQLNDAMLRFVLDLEAKAGARGPEVFRNPQNESFLEKMAFYRKNFAILF